MKKVKEINHLFMEYAQKIWFAGVGALTIAEEEGGKLFYNLVDKGREFEGKGKDKVEKTRETYNSLKGVANNYWDTFENVLEEKLADAINRLGLPSKDEVSEIANKVEELSQHIENILNTK